MQTHAKKRIEIFIEAPLLSRLTDRLDRAQATGYSVLPIVAGRGGGGAWSVEGQIGDAARMVAVVCIVDASKMDGILNAAFELISRQIGLVAISDVAVIRPELF